MIKIPDEIRLEYEQLENEVIWLHLKWEFYLQLFGVDEKRIELLNTTAPQFFGVRQDTMFDNLLISISRLTDPPKTGEPHKKRESLSLLRLVNSIDAKQCPELRRKVQNCWGKLITFAYQFENKLVGVCATVT